METGAFFSWLQASLRSGPESLVMVLTVATVVVMAGVLPSLRQHKLGWFIWLSWLIFNAWLLSSGPMVDPKTSIGTWRGYLMMGSLATGCVIAVIIGSALPLPKPKAKLEKGSAG